MKVAYFIGTLKKEDGVGVVLTNLIKEGNKKGVESLIVTGYAEDPSMVAARVIEVPAIVLPIYKEYKIPLPGMRGFKKALDEFHPDVIHIHSPDPVAWAALNYAKKNGVPIMATHHSDFARYLSYFNIASLKPAVHALLRKLYRQMAVVTSPSVETTEDISNKDVTVVTIPWGVDQTKFNPGFRSASWRTEILPEGGTHVILCICRLIWYKDLRVLADAYKLLMENRNDFRMVIAGDGPARAELETLMPGALFLGHIEGEELSKVYASTDILLFPSQTETFGNVTIESMSSGVVPVVANAGGSKSLVVDGVTGWRAEPGNPHDFYKKVVNLLEDPSLFQNMRAASLVAAKEYAWDLVYERFLKLYQECIINSGEIK